ncbi:hypothetical protein MMC97_03575 [Clostridioides difficile]|nr:hypothetical protein [Clostridioides difficile]MBY2543944.1 hypothetical protein [Clostridioides difficile]MBY2706194.1 hypothetical protein [Clostridioides difficile]MBZ1151534.1 hypothetical protein [Clostridioides difficile]MCH7239547.1 hypothetical protein [Clostridioides difficile]
MKIQMQLTKDKESFKVCVNSEKEELEKLFYEFVSQMLTRKRKSKTVQGDIEK